MFKKSHGFAPIFLIVLVVIVIGVSYYFGTLNGKKPQSVEPTSTPSPRIVLPTNIPSLPTNRSTSVPPNKQYELFIYNDAQGRFSFSYSSKYKILTSVPDSFNGTMLEGAGDHCGGPVLEDTSNPKVLIVITIGKADSDGGFCWSNGTFTNDNKWIGSGSTTWSGSYFVMKEFPKSSTYRGFVGLANKETYQLVGLEDLNQIVNSFKFTQ